MQEDYLHHIWKFKLFDKEDLRTTTGEKVEIIRSGEHNTDAGPDFFNARLRIGNTLWAGNVEIHTHASDWEKHGHISDKAYDNIILHVVYNADKDLKRSSGELIPTVEIKSRIPLHQYRKYLDFKSAKGWIACEKQIREVPSFILNSTLDKLLLERLEQRSAFVQFTLERNHNDWEESFYQCLARNFGFRTNAIPFEMLARSLPTTIVSKQKSSLLQVEALLFGQAGMLEDHYEDKYIRSLQNEYAFLKQKFRLEPIDEHLWKFLRLRPSNFPCIRIAQFASLMFNNEHLFSSILENEKLEDLRKVFSAEVSEYWQDHYVFDKVSKKRSKDLGEEALNTIIINTIVPFLFVYGKHYSEERYVARAIRFLEEIQGETNTIISKWKDLGMSALRAYDTQALLQLKMEYCQHKKCLNCNVGNYLLKNS